MPTPKIARPAAFCAALLFAPLAASAQEACTTYVVKDGDTLSTISMQAYGTYDYQAIFNANRDSLLQNINALVVGSELILPCKDGRLTADQDLTVISAAEDEKQAANRKQNSVYEPPLKFVTGNAWQPFADESLTGGGMLVRLATTALQRGGNDRQSTVSWVDDWGSHLDTLLPSGAYDISIAWSMPDCTKIDMLSEASVRRCTDFEASLPIYEVAESVTTLATSKYASARAFKDLAGAKICRPADWSAEELEIEGLVDPVVTMVRTKTPEECAEKLLAGEVDVYFIELETANKNFEEMNAFDKVVINPSLVKLSSYRFMTSKNNPRGMIYIAMLNKGLTTMRESGEWYDIVATGLSEYAKMSK